MLGGGGGDYANSNALFAYFGTTLAFLMFVKQLLPSEAWVFLDRFQKQLLRWASRETEVSIPEYVGYNQNQIYELVELHVSSLTSNDRECSANRVRLAQVKNSLPVYNLDSGETISEVFKGAVFSWKHIAENPDDNSRRLGQISMARHSYKLKTHKRNRNTILSDYLDWVLNNGRGIQHQNRERRIHINAGGDYNPWRSVPCKHPATFDSIAMEPGLKAKILEDLKLFMSGEGFFNRVGRAWKRGYLLYGPPGTGKSSLIAAIASFTQYDLYDLELTEVRSNVELRKLLMAVKNKSIIIIEDIDCSLELKKRGKPKPDDQNDDLTDQKGEDGKKKQEDRVTLSGLLNFIDGLWSCIASERIVIVTTNHKEQLDQALLRAGRMDLHILMSYCGFVAFKTLAWTHFEIQDHHLFDRIEQLLCQVEITPADVAEVLIQNRDDATLALESLIQTLEDRKSTVKSPKPEQP